MVMAVTLLDITHEALQNKIMYKELMGYCVKGNLYTHLNFNLTKNLILCCGCEYRHFS